MQFHLNILTLLPSPQVWLVEPAGGICRLLLRGAGRVRCLDVSASRARLAVADDAGVCRVYSLPDGQLLYTVSDLCSVASRECLAVADDAGVCRVYSLPDGQLLYTVSDLSSVASLGCLARQ